MRLKEAIEQAKEVNRVMRHRSSQAEYYREKRYGIRIGVMQNTSKNHLIIYYRIFQTFWFTPVGNSRPVKKHT